MTGISDQFTTIGVEAVAYGTKAATLTRGIEAEPGNKSAPRVEQRPSTGFRPGFLGNPTDRHVVDVRGGTYTLACDLLSKSHGMLLGFLNTPAVTTPGGATLARLHTITPSDNTLPSMTVHDGIALASGTIDHIDYLGGKGISLNLSVSPKGNVKAKVEVDYKTIDTSASSVTPSYASSPYVYRDTDVVTSIGGTDVCQRGIDLTIPTGAKIDRDRICPGGREEPIVMGRVEPTGTLSVDTASFAYLDDWLAGTARAIVFTITGPLIEDTTYNSVTITLPECRFTGEAPERSQTDLTMTSLPFSVFDNGTDPLWKIEYVTTDTAI